FSLSVALAMAITGCASTGALQEGPGAPRRPDGVAIDPISAPPPARSRAETTDGLVTLRTPLGVDRAIATVEELFHKVVLQDGEGIEAVSTRDAVAMSASSGSGSSPLAILFWQGRFRKLDYTKLAGEPLFREAELQIFRPDDALDAVPHPAVRP